MGRLFGMKAAEEERVTLLLAAEWERLGLDRVVHPRRPGQVGRHRALRLGYPDELYGVAERPEVLARVTVHRAVRGYHGGCQPPPGHQRPRHGVVVDDVHIDRVEYGGRLRRVHNLWHRFPEPVSRSYVIRGDEPLGPGGVPAGADQGHLVTTKNERVYQVGDHRLDPAVRGGRDIEVGRSDHRDVQLPRPNRDLLSSGEGRACGAHSERLLAS